MISPGLPLAVAFDEEEKSLLILDQTRLPSQVHTLRTTDVAEVAEAIKKLRVRGAPAIGVAAAFALVLSGYAHKDLSWGDFCRALQKDYKHLLATRPTAVNLKVGLDAVMSVLDQDPGHPVRALDQMEARALAFAQEDARSCRIIADLGRPLIQEGGSYMTLCNAGALATSNTYGTALAPFYKAHEEGVGFEVFACETRPLLQGARLTAAELAARGIPTTLICDSMAGALMARTRIDGVFIGADRIARNGDTANKIGSYGLACLARVHEVPFYVCAPETTFDWACPDGQAIPIEERGEEEVRYSPDGRLMVADRARVWNPAFDVVPHDLITAFITDFGRIDPPYGAKLGGKR